MHVELEEDKPQVSRLRVNGFCNLSEIAGESAAEIWVGELDWPFVPSGAVTVLHNEEGG